MDTIRNSGGNNIERLLIIASADDDIRLTCTQENKIPIDKSNKLAVSIHYFEPYDFTLAEYYEPYYWDEEDDYQIIFGPTLK